MQNPDKGNLMYVNQHNSRAFSQTGNIVYTANLPGKSK
jgi:hypothetical protein